MNDNCFAFVQQPINFLIKCETLYGFCHIDKEYEFSSALLFQCNLAHSLEERRTTPALVKTLDQGSINLITRKNNHKRMNNRIH